jgi:carboxyvinyl-carboxyphosphonate phosphorylmutase
LARVSKGEATSGACILRDAACAAPQDEELGDSTMTFRKRREALRAILQGNACVRPGSVYDATSIRIAQDLGFELGMFGGSVASLAVLGDPDITLITLTELCEQMRRMSRAATLPVIVDADHGYGNALNVRRTVQELEAAGAAGLTIEDTLLPQAFGVAEPQLISLEEGVGKMKAALAGRSDPSLVVFGRTGTRGGGPKASSFAECIERAKAYETTGVDALFFTGLTTREEVEAIASATKLPLVLGNTQGELDDPAFLISKRVKIALQGHAPFAAATQAVYETLKALREGTAPKSLKGLASSDLTGRVTRAADVTSRTSDFLGLKKA